MKGSQFCLLFLLSSLFIASAEDIILRDGRVLKDAEVVSHTDDSVSVQYAEGVTRVGYMELTDELQLRYGMTPADVEKRLQNKLAKEEARRQKAKAAEQAAEERAKKLRDSLSEAEKQPRYLSGRDVELMCMNLGEISSVESEFMALHWNMREAERVGLRHDAQIFRERLKDYAPKVDALKKQRQESEKYWTDLDENYKKLSKSSAEQIAALKQQVAQLKGEVVQAEQEKKTERIIITDVNRPWIIPPPPPIVIQPRPVPVRPVQVIRPKPAPPKPAPPRPAPSRPISPSSYLKPGNSGMLRR